MNPRLARLLIAAMLVGAITGSLVVGGEARACSCSNRSALDQLESAEVIVGGAPIEQYSDVDPEWDVDLIVWRFEVDERWRGDTPAIIELQARADEDSCGSPPTIRPSILALEWRRDNGRYDVSAGCGTPVVDRATLDRVFQPPPLDGNGAVRALAAADGSGHRLALLDESGGVLAYLPSDQRTLGLALCPSEERFIQLRPTSFEEWGEATSFELATWDLDGWVETAVVSVDPVDPWSEPPTMVCQRADGGEVRILWSEYSGETLVSDGEITHIPGPEADAHLFSFRIGGPSGSTLLINGNGSAIVTADGTQVYLEEVDEKGLRRSPSLRETWSILPVHDGWTAVVDRWEPIDDASDRRVAQRLHIGLDNRVTTSLPVTHDATLGWPVALVLPDGAPPAPAAEPAAALFARGGTEFRSPDDSTPGTAAPSDTEPVTDDTDDTENAGEAVEAGRSDGASGNPVASVEPSVDEAPIEASVETRTVRVGRVAGIGALLVLALLGAFGLRQLWRARASD